MNQVDLTGPVLLHSLFVVIQDNMKKLRGKLLVVFSLVLVQKQNSYLVRFYCDYCDSQFAKCQRFGLLCSFLFRYNNQQRYYDTLLILRVDVNT